jgi:hypothetical protein
VACTMQACQKHYLLRYAALGSCGHDLFAQSAL